MCIHFPADKEVVAEWYQSFLCTPDLAYGDAKNSVTLGYFMPIKLAMSRMVNSSASVDEIDNFADVTIKKFICIGRANGPLLTFTCDGRIVLENHRALPESTGTGQSGLTCESWSKLRSRSGKVYRSPNFPQSGKTGRANGVGLTCVS